MTPRELKDEIEKLDVSDKISLIADIWDSIARQNQQLPLPEWQRNELDRRYQEFTAGKQKLHDWKSVHEGLRKQYP
ncbi:MAG: addiction module protein [Desulfococcaceae bacterium]